MGLTGLAMDTDRGGLVPLLAIAALLLTGCADPGAGQRPGPGPAAAPWAWEMPQCVVYQPARYAAAGHRHSVTVHDGSLVVEQVEEYEAGWGPRAIEDIRAVVRDCGRYEYGDLDDPAGFSEQNRVVDTGFAGDESLLVETVRLAPPELETRYAAVVRYGDRVITLRASGLDADATRCLVTEDPATCPVRQT
jgi:hypothetical protein